MTQAGSDDLDAIVIGAGVGGVYAVYKLRQLGLRARALEKGADVGGTWYWNRYPGCRCDVESLEYSFSFSPELDQEWKWPERYGNQDEILTYVRHVADRFDVRKDIQFGTVVTSAVFDEAANRWTVKTDKGETIAAPYVIMATGNLSTPRRPDIKGIDGFSGKTYHTRPVAASRCRLHRPSGGRDRHRLVRRAVDPAHRQAGAPALRVPAHGQLLAAGAERADGSREGGQAQGRVSAAPR